MRAPADQHTILVTTLCVVTVSSDAPRLGVAPTRRLRNRRRASNKTFPRRAWEREVTGLPAMPTRLSRRCAVAALSVGVLYAAVRTSAADPAEPTFTPEQVAFYEKDVLPILKEHCLKCHGAEPKIKGGLNLTSRKAVLDGGDTGPAFDPKDPGKSLLLTAIHYKDDAYKMPPKGKLPAKELAVLTKWVADGLPFPAGAAHVAKYPKAGAITEEAKRYWAYQPVKRPAVPAVSREAKTS